MAVHFLDDDHYKSLDYTGWKEQEKCPSISSICSHLFPKIKRVTSLSENQDFSWFFGHVIIEGPGQVLVVYPYRDIQEDSFDVKNVCFSYFPYLVLEAKPLDGAVFMGWKGTDIQETSARLMIGPDDYPETAVFTALFEKDDEDLVGV